MAPKKFVPSKNPIRCRGSSSSSFAPSFLDSVRFSDEKAKDSFFENFSDRMIHLKCRVILSDFPNTPLLGEFSFRGWASLYEIPKRCPGVFIQEFYLTFMPSIPLYLGLLRYFEVHIL